jgi:hypothetical protein
MRNPQDHSTAYLLAVIAWCWVMIKIHEALLWICNGAMRWIERRRRR